MNCAVLPSLFSARAELSLTAVLRLGLREPSSDWRYQRRSGIVHGLAVRPLLNEFDRKEPKLRRPVSSAARLVICVNDKIGGSDDSTHAGPPNFGPSFMTFCMHLSETIEMECFSTSTRRWRD